MFGQAKKADARKIQPGISATREPSADVLLVAPDLYLRDREKLGAFGSHLPEGQRCEYASINDRALLVAIGSRYVVSLFNEPAQIDVLADQVLAARAGGADTVLIVVVAPSQLAALGNWLDRRASSGKLAGTRLMLAGDVESAAAQLPKRMQPVTEDNVIRMPVTTEVDNPSFKNFFVFSPELQALVARVRGFAQNGVARACLLGGPGSGKTTLAFYYFLVRAKGRFVSVNLAAENTGDKAQIKSLLCGHVSGAFPGAGARTGAFQHAREGVAFLDESHEINGAVMEVLMEALDAGQYLPLGASAKQPLECAVLYATNRSWAYLQNAVNLDQFTRLGAATLPVPELHRREEDMIAVAGTVLAKLGSRVTTWTAPTGLSLDAWAAIRACRWHGNLRALTRVLESAFVDHATTRPGEALIQVGDVENGIGLWEPKTHHSHEIYATN